MNTQTQIRHDEKAGPEQIPQQNPLFSEAVHSAEQFRLLGRSHFQAKRWEQALDSYRIGIKCLSQETVSSDSRPQAEQIKNLFAYFHAHAAQCCLQLNLFEQAYEEATACLKVAPWHMQALVSRATAAEKQGDLDKAISDFRRVEASSDAVLQGFAAAQLERLALETEGRLRERETGNGRFVSASRGVGPQQSPGASGHFARKPMKSKSFGMAVSSSVHGRHGRRHGRHGGRSTEKR